MSVQFTREELQLISDAIHSHRAWLLKTLTNKTFYTDLNVRMKALGSLQEKVLTELKTSSSDTR